VTWSSKLSATRSVIFRRTCRAGSGGALSKIAREAAGGTAFFGGVDSYFNAFLHLLSGTGRIDTPLSAYRIHGRNDFTGFAGFHGAYCGSRAAEQRNQDVRLLALRTITEKVSELAWFLHPEVDRFWKAFDVIPARKGAELARFHLALAETWSAHFPELVGAFGTRIVLRELRSRLPRSQLSRMLAVRHKRRGFLHRQLELLLIEIDMVADSLRRKLKKLRQRKQRILVDRL
jgi:hypothetical protein